MNREAVKSSAIAAVGHEGDTLEVEMPNGTIYRYPGVTAEEHAALMAADSIGKHFAANIRGRQFEKIVPEKDGPGAQHEGRA